MKHPWYKRIHRGQLHKTLGLPNKLPRNFQGVFPGVKVYEFWERYEYDAYVQDIDGSYIKHEKKVKETMPWGEFTIFICPTPDWSGPPQQNLPGARKSSLHRVHFECKCGRLIPIGRSHQHLPHCQQWLDAHSE